jgi:hypothetical protein
MELLGRRIRHLRDCVDRFTKRFLEGNSYRQTREWLDARVLHRLDGSYCFDSNVALFRRISNDISTFTNRRSVLCYDGTLTIFWNGEKILICISTEWIFKFLTNIRIILCHNQHNRPHLQHSHCSEARCLNNWKVSCSVFWHGRR